MLIFGAYKGQRLTLDVPVGTTVKALKETIHERLGIPLDTYSRDNKVMVLSYAGAELGDTWVFSDLGILPGSTFKIQLRDNVQPVLYVRCSHNQETLNVFNVDNITNMKLNQVRGMASMMSGLPVGVFRLTTSENREMYDSHCLEDYNVDVSDTILLETWDGWNEFLNLAIMGFTSQVMTQLSEDDVIARYQMKVAMFIAAHFGHVDLARSVLRQGVRSDEATGYHPSRTWCKDNGHVDSLKCPVHEATLCGQVGVLRLFVTHEISCLKAKDGNGLEPLNIALRGKIKNCASFLLSKQWTQVNITKTFTVHVGTYAMLRKWCERAKERALMKYGPGKSSLKRRSFSTGPLLSHGIFVDGFSVSPMTGKSKTELLKEGKNNMNKETSRQRFSVPVAELLGSTDEPERYFRSILAAQGTKFRQRSRQHPLRWQKSSISSKLSKDEGSAKEISYTRSNLKVKSQFQNSNSEFSKFRTSSTFTEDSETTDYVTSKLPLITQNLSMRRTPRTLKDNNTDDSKMKNGNILITKLSNKELDELVTYKNDSIQSLSLNKGAISHRNLNLLQENDASSSNNQPLSSHDGNNSKTSLRITRNIMSGNGKLKIKNETENSEESGSTNTDEVFSGENKPGKIKKRKGISTSLLQLRMNTNTGSVTLPIVSREQGRRPFFYHNGVREDELVNSVYKHVTKYKGNSNRERALNSLNLANSFSEKPWLCRVRLALNVTSNSIKRDVRPVQT